MGKNRLTLHLVAILGIVFFAFLAIGSSSTTTPAVTASTEVKKTTGENRVSGVWPAPQDRQYDTLGLVFASSTTKLENGREIANEEDVIIMLLREAQKLGGTDIINYRWSESVVTSEETRKERGSDKKINTVTRTKTGSALAIKYRNGSDAYVPPPPAPAPAPSGNSGNSILTPNRFVLEGTVK